jgi:hypothetical protein
MTIKKRLQNFIQNRKKERQKKKQEIVEIKISENNQPLVYIPKYVYANLHKSLFGRNFQIGAIQDCQEFLHRLLKKFFIQLYQILNQKKLSEELQLVKIDLDDPSFYQTFYSIDDREYRLFINVKLTNKSFYYILPMEALHNYFFNFKPIDHTKNLQKLFSNNESDEIPS